jgi:hypothetical protein
MSNFISPSAKHILGGASNRDVDAPNLSAAIGWNYEGREEREAATKRQVSRGDAEARREWRAMEIERLPQLFSGSRKTFETGLTGFVGLSGKDFWQML